MPVIDSLFTQANAHLAAREIPDAIEVLRIALALDDTFAEGHANLAWALERAGDLAQAEKHYLRAVDLAPHQLQIRLNYGAILLAQRRLTDALVQYEAALAIDPHDPSALSSLGTALVCAGREDEAEPLYRRAQKLDPSYWKAEFNLAYLLLRQGRWEEGWQRMEARDWPATIQHYLNLPRWDGKQAAGARILVGIEAGHGDMIQFGRYCAQIKAAGAARVGILCHPGLAELFKGLIGADEIIATDQPFSASAWDAWVPALSLPFHFGTRVDTVPARLPYIVPDPTRADQLASHIAITDDDLKVGLVWKGSPRFENDAERSLPSLSVLAPLLAAPGVRYFSLQKGEAEADLRLFDEGRNVTNLAPAISDFGDTAALIQRLDLVISVDTAVAHLAGALGKRCWVMLPAYLTDWRWLTNRDDTPWYPGVMRLFRQRRRGNWSDVVTDITMELQRLRAGATR